MPSSWLVLAAPLVLAAVAVTSPARAAPLFGQREAPPDGYATSCTDESADVLRWTPADGPLASFVVDAYLASSSVFVGLGYDQDGFWSAEGDSGVDACDDCSTLRLVHTTFAGVRQSFVVGRGADLAPEASGGERRAAMKRKILALAAGPLDVGALRQDYALALPKHDAEGRIERFTGWFAEVEKKDGALLRFGLVSRTIMCWCEPQWVGYTLAQPKKHR